MACTPFAREIRLKLLSLPVILMLHAFACPAQDSASTPGMPGKGQAQGLLELPAMPATQPTYPAPNSPAPASPQGNTRLPPRPSPETSLTLPPAPSPHSVAPAMPLSAVPPAPNAQATSQGSKALVTPDAAHAVIAPPTPSAQAPLAAGGASKAGKLAAPLALPPAPPGTAGQAVLPNVNTPAKPLASKPPETKNADLLDAPVPLADTSLFFSKKDMEVIIGALNLYDSGREIPTGPGEKKEDLLSLLDSLKPHDGQVTEGPPPLPNLYLGSIVYYTPRQWTVWINGKKLTGSNNLPRNEFYVTALSRTAIELSWKPASLQDIPALWEKLTDKGAHPLPGIILEDSGQTLRLHMHPNQTFLPKSLSIREGLIRSKTVPAAAESFPDPHDKSGFMPRPMPPLQNQLQSSGMQLKNISSPLANGH